MIAAKEDVCAHCEARPAGVALGLCPACHGVKGIRVLYLRRRGWTPQWEAHLRALTRRAAARLPLFECRRPRLGGCHAPSTSSV